MNACLDSKSYKTIAPQMKKYYILLKISPVTLNVLQSSHTPRSSSTISNTVDKMVLDFFKVIRYPGLSNLH
ncbi:hypothetical protein QVD17_37354 [Tagetes erecta]|uniref:Uncharacterized protein n=1 Tax=Tagetes erecta TaxID=13708 RepID=A0AAD8JU33_TARER|nr:hypothetical protein QVD17_37354 [Tagetes erecta]